MDKAEFQAMWENTDKGTKAQGGWSGPAVVVNLPHRGTPELLDTVLPLWLGQSVPVAVDVVDTGSSWSQRLKIEHLCDEHRNKARLHTIAPRPWMHPSEPIAMACELSQMYAETDYLLFSHVDVFPHSRHLVRWLMDQCSANCPVVGYEISPRDSVAGWLRNNWQGMVGHSLTMVHLPTIRTASIRWPYNEPDLRQVFKWDMSELAGWDTEVSFNLWLKLYGIKPKIVGHDQNREHLVDQWHGHARSYPGSLLFGHPHLQEARKWIDLEVQQARNRLKTWSS